MVLLAQRHLARTRLEFEADPEPALKLTFSDKTAFALIGEDTDFRKGMQTFLGGKLPAQHARGLVLRCVLDVSLQAEAETPAIPLPGIEGIMLREPIVKTVRDLFDGRILKY